jgi:tryptophan synthase alpha chain
MIARAESSSADGAARTESALRAAVAAGRPALAAYLVAGFPARDVFPRHLRSVAAVADLVEVGVPFSDPMADGVTIQRAARAALAAGVGVRAILRELRGLAPELRAPVVLMGYLNPFLAYGLGALARDAAAAGVAGFIVPDLPLEESEPVRAELERAGLALVQLVTPASPPERLAALCRASRGFVYAVTVAGTTGARDGLPSELAAYLERVRAQSTLPVLAGFGIRGREQVCALAPHADGVVVGSALIEAVERGEDPAQFLRGLLA